ncbi:FAD-dependent monooxygenase [Nocardia cerradoensis]|uniref:Salicyloyl-CoA 5-hydroxylase n=1 Tax=Nocardia cerradoensis TaxID=85688 RepID=A0A231GZM3_9NOCA|nr:FAD-dependent monooxygenase [Nocardia cerradoensis]NKY41879.1 monooxygenase [Nocardia cerradoensis]OXR42063.1 Salicyloyl-CoA 5-hydroxylase [Nocardia cerradoensis]
MARRHVSVLGGGPGGLFAARLLALRHPDWTIKLFERLQPTDTFGFGVGLSAAALSSIRAVDPQSCEQILAHAIEFSSGKFDLPSGSVEIPGFHSGIAVGRTALLAALVQTARDAGVEVNFGSSHTAQALSAESDLVVAADGVSSSTRERYNEAFGPEITLGRGRYIWCGSEAPLDGTVFMPVHTPAGTFTTHAYPYAPGRSTFVIETDEQTLQNAGFDTRDIRSGRPDDGTLTFLSEQFQPLLQGHKFIGNKSWWFQFRNLSCRRWSHENIVLLGDAAATADPSLGSGTKLAMESAIALADALETWGERPLAEALDAFEQTRRPAIGRFQGWAGRSQLWWDSFPQRLHLGPARIAVAYLSRTGAVPLESALTTSEAIMRTAAAEWAGVDAADIPTDNFVDWVLGRPLHTDRLHTETRIVDATADVSQRLVVTSADPWDSAGDAVVERVRECVRSDGRPVLLTGGADRDSLLDRLAVAERVRLETGATVAVTAAPDFSSDVVAGLLAGRIDLVHTQS